MRFFDMHILAIVILVLARRLKCPRSARLGTWNSSLLHRFVPQIFLKIWRPCSKDHATFYALDFVFWYSSYDVPGSYYDVILYCVKSSMKTHIRMCTSNWPVFIFANFYPVFQCIFLDVDNFIDKCKSLNNSLYFKLSCFVLVNFWPDAYE